MHTFVNITGDTAFVRKVLVKSSGLASDNLVDFGAIPALLNRTFNPLSLTTSSTCFAITSNDPKSVTSNFRTCKLLCFDASSLSSLKNRKKNRIENEMQTISIESSSTIVSRH